MKPQGSPANDIRNLSPAEIRDYLTSIGEKPFRAQQITDWVYHKGVGSFDEMRNIAQPLRDRLAADFILGPHEIAKKEVSEDGTTKFLFRLADGERVETVLIPTKTRTTACVSTQAGCKFGCRFCASGIGGWTRNLSCAEILTQLLHVKEEAAGHARPLSHIVFMGIGEPLDNYDNLMKAIRLINDPAGLNIGARRITVSTCGVIPRILDLGQEGLQVELAISLHGYDNQSRNVLMPVNKKYPFDELIAACRTYQKSYRRQITFEYILIKDVTCTPEAINALKQAFRGLICKMNLIPYNPVAEFDHQTPSRNEMVRFRDELTDFGVHATIRTPRGKDINSACGQLRHA